MNELEHECWKCGVDGEGLRREYPILVRYSAVVAMGAEFGLTKWGVRKLMEGEGAPIPKIQPPGSGRAFYERDAALAVFSR